VIDTLWTDESDAQRWTVTAHGELDLDTAPELRDHVASVLSRTDGEVVVDLTGVSFCDSSGLAVLVASRRRAQLLGRRLVLRVAKGDRVDALLELSNLSEHFDVDRV
jgi:anti-sigma B factor antagonist